MGAALADKPRVLAFADGRDSLVAACRVHAPLGALQKAGLIRDYVVTDARLTGLPRYGLFDVVWLQRGVDTWLARALTDRLGGRFLLDVDDHLLCSPEYLQRGDLPDPAAIRAILAACRVLTTPSRRLASLLERRSGLELASKAIVCPNAIDFGATPPRTTSRPAAILLTQGHRLALTASANEVLEAVAEFAARRGLPIWRLGASVPTLDALAAGAGATAIALRPRDYLSYHRSLAGPPQLLGVAPLETRGDPVTNEFVAGKSDIKMVEFGGFGHPAVYSRAAPYVDTDLRCGRLTDNDFTAWRTALDEAYDVGVRVLADEQRSVREQRGIGRMAREAWWPALEAARMERPVDVAELVRDFDRVLAAGRDRIARVRWRLRHRLSIGEASSG
jgi:hypothetical protein